VSSKEQEQGFSIPAQLRLLCEYAQHHGYTVVEEFTDVETAKRTGRTAFTEMLAYLRKHNLHTVLVEKTDQLYRNIKDWVTIDELGLELHFVKENVILTPESRSSEKFMHGIKVLMAKNYIDNLSEETKKGMLEEARSGLWPSYAPIGYTNTTGPDGKRIITPDPNTAPVITQLFEWFATGTLSLKTLAAKARNDGLRLDDQKLHKSLLHHILRKRLYSGDFDWDGKTYHGTHQALVSKATWERVQELLDAKTRRKKMSHDFTYSGIINCGHCGCQLVAELKKGKYVYYRCTNGKNTDCPEPYTREEVITTRLTTILGELVVPKPITDWLRAALQQTDVTETRAREQALQQAQAAYDRINDRINAMYLDKLDAKITTEYYDQKASSWRQEQAALARRINGLRTTSQNYEKAINAIENTSTLCKQFPTKPRWSSAASSSSSSKKHRGNTDGSKPPSETRLSNSGSRTPQPLQNTRETGILDGK
jgi:DNA invertase Pin-like site-specific DNA recombinase